MVSAGVRSFARAHPAPAEIYHLKVAGKQNWGKLDLGGSSEQRCRTENGTCGK